jgi:fumarate hydratase subunit beta
MTEIIHLTTPLTDEVARSLHAGDRVLLSGRIYTARDAAHKRLVEAINAGGDLPFDPQGQIIYYVGPSPTKPGDVIGSAGPTTAGRVDYYTIPLLVRGLKGMIGKGKRSAEVRQGMMDYGAVYLVAVGGAAALIADRIKSVELVAYEDLGTEAIRCLEVEDFPLMVANDTYGGDVYEQGKAAYKRVP